MSIDDILNMKAGHVLDTLIATDVMKWESSESDFFDWITPDGDCLGDGLGMGFVPSRDPFDAFRLFEHCRDKYGEDLFAEALSRALHIRDCEYRTVHTVALVIRNLTPEAIARAALIAEKVKQ